MKNKKSFLVLGIIVLILFLGVGYAVVSSVYLNVGGSASVTDSVLDVEITNAVATTSVSGKSVDFSHQLSNNNLTSTFTINDMIYDETVSIVYTVTSNETDIDAFLSDVNEGVILKNSNHNYFNVDYTIIDSTTNLKNNDRTMTVKVMVELMKTPVSIENSSTTIELTLNASPLKLINSLDGSTTETPLKLDEKYYLTTWAGNDVKHNNWWISFDKDGNMTQSDNKNFSIAGSYGNIYTKSSIVNDSNMAYMISSDGLFLINTFTRYGNMIFVVESLFNTIKNYSFNFGEKYVCIVDNKNSDSSALGTYLKIYPNGSVDVGYSNNDFEYLPSDTVEYTEIEITSDDLPEGDKLIISSDGLTITYISNGQTLYTFQNNN